MVGTLWDLLRKISKASYGKIVWVKGALDWFAIDKNCMTLHSSFELVRDNLLVKVLIVMSPIRPIIFKCNCSGVSP
jgi:hypothetical protein